MASTVSGMPLTTAAARNQSTLMGPFVFQSAVSSQATPDTVPSLGDDDCLAGRRLGGCCTIGSIDGFLPFGRRRLTILCSGCAACLLTGL